MCSLRATRSQRQSTTTDETEATIAVTTAEQATLTAEVFFLIRRALHALCDAAAGRTENVAVRALIQMAPWVLLTVLLFSLLGGVCIFPDTSRGRSFR